MFMNNKLDNPTYYLESTKISSRQEQQARTAGRSNRQEQAHTGSSGSSIMHQAWGSMHGAGKRRAGGRQQASGNSQPASKR